MNDKPLTAKEYLAQVYRIDQRINAKLDQVENLRALTRKATVSYGSEPVSHTRKVTAMEDTIIRLMEAEYDLTQQIDKLLDKKMEIAACIEKVDKPNEQMLLEKRYLCFQTWEQIATDMKCTVRWAHILHERALRVIDRTRCVEVDYEQA